MSKPIGTTEQKRNRWYARLIVEKTRERFPLPTCATKEAAEERKEIMVNMLAKLRAGGIAAATIRELLTRAGARDGKALEAVIAASEAIAAGRASPRGPMLAGYPPKSAPRTSGVYFVQAGERGPIKIGHAASIRRRIKEIQTSSPFELAFVGAIHGAAASEEKALHGRFADLRLRGEWFAPRAALVDFIRALPVEMA